MTIADYTDTPLTELMSLEDRTAVITGGARGIGFAIARRFMEAGANVVIADIDVGGCMENALHELNQSDAGSAVGFNYDVRDRNAMERTANHAAHQFGALHIWVNDAGIYPSSPLMELPAHEWDEVIATNITGVYHGSRAAVPHMKAKGGVILNLASIAGIQGEEDLVHYNATKFAVRGLTAGLAKEVGEYNIRVVGIAPTMVDTPGIHEQLPHVRKEMKELSKQIPLGRISAPDDIARMALVLASDLAAYVTGTTFVVDGGNLALG